jgi:2,3-bisphosphoglycerate-dependent phosphoglycerate mutase/probable phosphoglycerate mutase
VRKLLIIRHGESEWNVEKRWQGWLDAPLTTRGLQQSRVRADALVGARFRPRIVLTSDLGRAQQTAEIIADALGVPCRPDPGLRERNGGEWEGSTGFEIDERWPGMRDAWRRGEITAPPGGEEDSTVLARFDAAIASALDSDVPPLVVTHHGVLRLVATRAGADVRALIPNLGGYWFAVEHGTLHSPEPLDVLPEPADEPPVE